MKEVMDKTLESELWHACAGSMVQIPPVNSKVVYFPQGHAEHALSNVDFGALPRIPPLILCRVAYVNFLADPNTDEVYAKIGLIPVGNNDLSFDDGGIFGSNVSESSDKRTSFAKTLTQSDANNGGGFSVPRYCAETIFPRLEYTADPPVQMVVAKDVHGEHWTFRHIYRGAPRRHLLTTGWSNFVNQKKLVAGDSIVFLRAENGDLRVGIRRAKRSGGVSGNEPSSLWNSGSAGHFGGFSAFLGDDNKLMQGTFCDREMRERGRVRPETVIEAALHAANGQHFEVVYYPRAGTPEFCVKASSVWAALLTKWCPGIRFKMAFETEDSSRISWFMGTVTTVQFNDPKHWPNSPWRLLQVTWDEPDLLQNVKCVRPWLVEMVTSIPVLPLSPFSPPRKKFRLPPHTDFPPDGQFPMPSFLGNPLKHSSPVCFLPDSIAVGIQGARHSQIGGPLSDLHIRKIELLPHSFPRLDFHHKIVGCKPRSTADGSESVACLLNIGNCGKKSEKKEVVKAPLFILFGQPILTEQQMAQDQSSDTVSELALERSSNNAEAWMTEYSSPFSPELPKSFYAQLFHKRGRDPTELDLDTCHCQVFLDSEDVGLTLDLSLLGSYEKLYRKLKQIFGIENTEIVRHLFYLDATGVTRQAGEEPFSEFMKSAKRLTVPATLATWNGKRLVASELLSMDSIDRTRLGC